MISCSHAKAKAREWARIARARSGGERRVARDAGLCDASTLILDDEW